MENFETLQSLLISSISKLHFENRNYYDSNCPLVSIIVPSYNQGTFLEKTLISLFNQEYPCIEYIIIDGASQDKSVDIIKKYEKNINYWVSEKDNGQSEAINKGLNVAKGKYVTWIGADDILFPYAIRVMVDGLEKHPDASLVYGGGVFIDKDDQILKKFSFTDLTLQKLLYHKHSTLAQPSSLLRMEVIKKIGFLDETLHYCMDYDLWIRMIKAGKFVNLGDIVLSAYRLHSDSKTVGSYTKMALEKIKVNRRYTNDIINKVIYKHYWYILENLFRKYFKRSK